MSQTFPKLFFSGSGPASSSRPRHGADQPPAVPFRNSNNIYVNHDSLAERRLLQTASLGITFSAASPTLSDDSDDITDDEPTPPPSPRPQQPMTAVTSSIFSKALPLDSHSKSKGTLFTFNYASRLPKSAGAGNGSFAAGHARKESASKVTPTARKRTSSTPSPYNDSDGLRSRTTSNPSPFANTAATPPHKSASPKQMSPLNTPQASPLVLDITNATPNASPRASPPAAIPTFPISRRPTLKVSPIPSVSLTSKPKPSPTSSTRSKKHRKSKRRRSKKKKRHDIFSLNYQPQQSRRKGGQLWDEESSILFSPVSPASATSTSATSVAGTTDEGEGEGVVINKHPGDLDLDSSSSSSEDEHSDVEDAGESRHEEQKGEVDLNHFPFVLDGVHHPPSNGKDDDDDDDRASIRSLSPIKYAKRKSGRFDSSGEDDEEDLFSSSQSRTLRSDDEADYDGNRTQLHRHSRRYGIGVLGERIALDEVPSSPPPTAAAVPERTGGRALGRVDAVFPISPSPPSQSRSRSRPLPSYPRSRGNASSQSQSRTRSRPSGHEPLPYSALCSPPRRPVPLQISPAPSKNINALDAKPRIIQHARRSRSMDSLVSGSTSTFAAGIRSMRDDANAKARSPSSSKTPSPQRHPHNNDMAPPTTASSGPSFSLRLNDVPVEADTGMGMRRNRSLNRGPGHQQKKSTLPFGYGLGLGGPMPPTPSTASSATSNGSGRVLPGRLSSPKRAAAGGSAVAVGSVPWAMPTVFHSASSPGPSPGISKQASSPAIIGPNVQLRRVPGDELVPRKMSLTTAK